MKDHIPILIILAVSAVLLFTGLGNQYLWQDEAETATIASNVLKYGFPRGMDERGNLVNPTIRTGYGPDYGWKYHSWGQFYIAAPSIYLFGRTSFAARLPFALMGLLNIFLVYALALRMTREKQVAVFGAVMTALSVPFVLLMRQCRYYAPAVMLVLLGLYFYAGFIKGGKRRDLWLSALSLALLAHTVHGMFVPMSAALAAHYLLFTDRKRTLEVLFAALAVIAAALPWFMYSNSFAHVNKMTFTDLKKNLEFQIRMINKFIFPAVFLAVVYAVRLLAGRGWKLRVSPDEKKTILLFGMLMASSMAAFTFAQERNFRYLVYFIPLFSIIWGMMLLRLYRYNKALLALFLAAFLLTDAFYSGKPRFFLPKYLYEITHDYDGPIEGIIKFLKENARAGDTVKITYGDIAVMFYTDLKVDNSKKFDKEHVPEWIVFRRWWDGAELIEYPYFKDLAATHEKYVLDYPDIPWENRPDDLSYHRFSTDKEAPGVIIFGKRREE